MRHAGKATRSVVLSNRTVGALLGGFAGGLAFGLLMQVTDIVLMVAALVGRESASVGWVVHMSIALLFGLLYALLFRAYADSFGSGVIAGVLYGWAWWIVGGLIIMPAWLGRSDLIFQFTATAWQSLLGHIIYGLLLGTVCAAIVNRLDWRARARHGSERQDLTAIAEEPTAHEPAAISRRQGNGAAGVLAASRGITSARGTASPASTTDPNGQRLESAPRG